TEELPGRSSEGFLFPDVPPVPEEALRLGSSAAVWVGADFFLGLDVSIPFPFPRNGFSLSNN
ncbi:hypothetical protein MSG28_000596, partial [Choristoneura fumiferana]